MLWPCPPWGRTASTLAVFCCHHNPCPPVGTHCSPDPCITSVSKHQRWLSSAATTTRTRQWGHAAPLTPASPLYQSIDPLHCASPTAWGCTMDMHSDHTQTTHTDTTTTIATNTPTSRVSGAHTTSATSMSNDKTVSRPCYPCGYTVLHTPTDASEHEDSLPDHLQSVQMVIHGG
jgi:hypothetical protein